MSLTLRVKGFASQKDVRFLLAVLAVLFFVVLLQQLLPSGGLLPFARVDGSLKRIQTPSDITTPYRQREERELTLIAGDYSSKHFVKDLGVRLDEAATLTPYTIESRWKRLIPFSVLAHMYQNNKPVYTSSKTSLLIVTTAMSDEVNRPAVNASIRSENSTPKIVPSVSGIDFEPQKAIISVFDAIDKGETSVRLPSETIEPEVTTSELEQALEPFVASLPDVLSIRLGNEQFQLPRSTLVSWLDYTVEESKPIIGFNTTELNAYAEELTEKFASGQQPTVTTVSLTDGKETSRIAGKPGKTIVPEALTGAIEEAITSGQKIVEAQLVDVPSPVVYTRTYTRSSEGLKDMLDQITKDKEISVRFIDINSRGWDVGSRANSPSYMASTYKMFVAYSVLKRIDAGSMSFSETINGKSMDACLKTMIIDSDNACAIAIAERIGWITIQNEGKALGATGLNWMVELTGTVSDAAIIPTKLARAEILTPSSRSYLLDLMQRQRFRAGIPSGTPHLVANKVGFYEGWLNDAGIVYAPDLPYVLAIYTKGQSWATVADITRQIESLVR